MVQFGQKLPVLPFWEIGSRLKPTTEKKRHFSRANESNESVFWNSIRSYRSFPCGRLGKTGGLERVAKLILVDYLPPKCCHAGISPWTPKQKQSSLAPGFSWSPKSERYWTNEARPVQRRPFIRLALFTRTLYFIWK